MGHVACLLSMNFLKKTRAIETLELCEESSASAAAAAAE